jgi:hypothetical protein
MPVRESGESLNHYIGRFAGNKREERKLPDIKQRLAVAYSEARKSAKKSKGEKHG